MDLKLDGKDGTIRVRVMGEVLGGATVDLAETVRSAATKGVERIEIDLADVPFIDSGGLGTLVALRADLLGRGVSLALASPSPAVARALETTRLSTLFADKPRP